MNTAALFFSFLLIYLFFKCMGGRNATLSASATLQIFSPVLGFRVGKVFPLTASTNSLLMNSCRNENTFIDTVDPTGWKTSTLAPSHLGVGYLRLSSRHFGILHLRLSYSRLDVVGKSENDLI